MPGNRLLTIRLLRFDLLVDTLQVLVRVLVEGRLAAGAAEVVARPFHVAVVRGGGIGGDRLVIDRAVQDMLLRRGRVLLRILVEGLLVVGAGKEIADAVYIAMAGGLVRIDALGRDGIEQRHADHFAFAVLGVLGRFFVELRRAGAAAEIVTHSLIVRVWRVGRHLSDFVALYRAGIRAGLVRAHGSGQKDGGTGDRRKETAPGGACRKRKHDRFLSFEFEYQAWCRFEARRGDVRKRGV